MLKQLARDSVLYTVPTFVSRAISILLVPLYTRVLSPSDYGALDLIIVFGSLVNLTIALEVSQGLARRYSQETDESVRRAYASTALWFTVICYSVFFMVAVVFAAPLTELLLGDVALVTVFRAGVALIWFNGLFYVIQNQLRWELRSGAFSAVSVVMALVTAGASLAFAYGLHWGLMGMIAGLLAGTLTGTVVGLVSLRRSFRFQLDAVRLKTMLRFSIPLVPSAVAVFVTTSVDRLAIKHFLTLEDVGMYGIAFRLASVIGFLMIGVQGALTPLIYAHHGADRTPMDLALILRTFTAIALLGILGLSLFASEILQVFTTPAYFPAAKLVVYLAPAVLLARMYVFAPGLWLKDRTDVVLWINVTGACVCLVLNVLLVPATGVRGAAMASLLTSGVVFVLYMHFSQKLYYVPHEWRPLGVGAGITTGLAWTVPMLPTGGWITMLIKCAAMLLAGYCFFLVGLVRMPEIRRATAVIAGRPGGA